MKHCNQLDLCNHARTAEKFALLLCGKVKGPGPSAQANFRPECEKVGCEGEKISAVRSNTEIRIIMPGRDTGPKYRHHEQAWLKGCCKPPKQVFAGFSSKQGQLWWSLLSG